MAVSGLRLAVSVLPVITLLSSVTFRATKLGSPSDPTLPTSDELAWLLFIEATHQTATSPVAFEAWATDDTTFNNAPFFPQGRLPINPRSPALELVITRSTPLVLPFPASLPEPREEVRRNRAAYDYIVNNNLNHTSGLSAIYKAGQPPNFPPQSVEVKTSWVLLDDLARSTSDPIGAGDLEHEYYVTTDVNNTKWALVSLHVISKLVPNWTWATFEHELNPARCDYMGCVDTYGALKSPVLPNETYNQVYPACGQSQALMSLWATARLAPALAHYCLKGTQIGFTDATGLATRLGSSVTERNVLPNSSCMTCHARSSFDACGRQPQGTVPPIGAVNPSWFWQAAASDPTPLFVGEPGLVRTMMPSDFVWSIPLRALSDSQNCMRR